MRRARIERTHALPLGLIVAGVALLLIGAIARLASGRATLTMWLSLGAGIALIAGVAVAFRSDTRRLLTVRQTVYGAVVAVSVLVVLAVAVMANLLVARRFDRQIDFTAEKYFTLADQSVQIVRSLKEPVHVIGFFTTDASDFRYRDRQLAEQLLKLYARTSGGKLTFEFLDPYQNAQKAQAYDVQFESKTVFEMGGRRESASTVSEPDFTSALLKLTQDETLKVYFTTGHDERPIDEYARNGYSDAAETLRRQNYELAKLALRATNPMAVPADASAVVIAGPRLAFEPGEIQALDAYIEHGGRVLALFDPPTTDQAALGEWLSGKGVTVGNDLVVDLSAFYQSFENPIAQMQSHAITTSIRQYIIPFVGSSSVTPLEPMPAGWEASRLIETTDNELASWAESDLMTFPPRKDGADVPAPVSMGVALTKQSGSGTDGRIVVFGDSDFASNAVAPTGGADLLLNAVNWLTLQEDLIAIPAKDPSQRQLKPVVTRAEALAFLTVTWFLVPILVSALGVIVWIRRR
ncbi:hypothetical protein FJZ36_11435 [Candidatus Poribacteria bacterium]|nr:hypothetical protein [Candidatus Poribacteria bacterium]